MPDDHADPLQLHDAGIGTAQILAELTEVRADLKAILAALGERERVLASRLHLRAGAEFAVEIASAIGDATFDARELVDHALREDARLRAGIVRAVGPIDAGVTRRIGRLLARCEGALLPPGFRVERVDDGAADCATWRVLRV